MNPNEYSQCLKDAEKLITSKFIPAIDDIQERTVSNVLFKVLIEFDLMNEGELESMIRQDKMRKTKQVKKFFEKWIDRVLPEEQYMYRI